MSGSFPNIVEHLEINDVEGDIISNQESQGFVPILEVFPRDLVLIDDANCRLRMSSKFHSILNRLKRGDPTLTDVTLRDNMIGDQETQELAQALTTNTYIQKINLGDNRIGDRGVQALARALKTNTSLHRLYLGGNMIGDHGAQALAQALLINSSLRELYMPWNNIGDQGVQFLARSLTINTSLQFLHLGGNKMRGQGLRAVTQTMLINYSLTYLVISYSNNILGQLCKINKIPSNHQREYNDKIRKQKIYRSIVI